MAPKSNQAARRAARRDGSDELDSGNETELYDQLPPRAQADVCDVAAVLTYEYGITIETAMPMANRMRREERARFDRTRHEAGTMDSPRFNARGMFVDLPPHIQAEIRPVAAENFRGGLSMPRALEEAIKTVLEQHPDVVDQELRARGYVGSYIDENGTHQPIFEDECSVCGLTYQSNAESGIFVGRTYCSSGCLATMGPQAKGKGKGFEPFSGTSHRLD